MMGDCFYLNVFEEKCLQQDEDEVIKLRFWLYKFKEGTKIVTVYFTDEKEYFIVDKSIEPAYDSFFGIITNRFPIKYNVMKSLTSESKFIKWRSDLIALLNSNSTILENHDRLCYK